MTIEDACVMAFSLVMSLIVWTWFGYAFVLLVVVRTRRCTSWKTKLGSSWPSITIVIAAHNEESVIRRRLQNCLDLDYPSDKLEIIVSSDHSTDNTDAIVLSFGDRRIRLIRATRRGKSLAQNEAIREAKNQIVVFSDADTLFVSDFLKQIAQPFADPQVGCVSGRLVWTNPGESAVAVGGSFYWRYEHFLWGLESQLGILAWSSGACMAVRRDLFKPMEPQYGEDCVVPLDVISQGYRVVFQPDAVAREKRTADPNAELRTRARMTLRSFTGTLSYKQLLNPFRYPGIAVAIMSHKILRWLTPYSLLVALVLNLLLLSHSLFRLTFAAQLTFYLAGLIGYLADRWRLNIPVLSVVYSFCLTNLAMFLGVTKALLGHQVVAYRSEG